MATPLLASAFPRFAPLSRRLVPLRGTLTCVRGVLQWIPALASLFALVLSSATSVASATASATAVRIALVSDTHMAESGSEKAALHRARFEQAIAAVNRARVDLVLIAGDLTEDGKEAELKDFASLAARFEAPVCAVPGNHDIGAKVNPAKKTGPSAERLARYESVLGPASYVRRVAGLRVIAIAGSLLGSGLPAEAAVWKLLERECAAPSKERTLLLTHYPPYTKKSDEPADPYWNVDPAPRARLLSLLKQGGVRLVLSGHLHRPLDVREPDGLTICVTPPVSFGLPAGKQPEGWTLVTLSKEGGLTREFHPLSSKP